MTSSRPEPSADPEAARRAVAGAAMDIDAVAERASRAIGRLGDRDDPNVAIALRRAVASLHETAAALRREGLLQSDQYKLL